MREEDKQAGTRGAWEWGQRAWEHLLVPTWAPMLMNVRLHPETPSLHVDTGVPRGSPLPGAAPHGASCPVQSPFLLHELLESHRTPAPMQAAPVSLPAAASLCLLT